METEKSLQQYSVCFRLIVNNQNPDKWMTSKNGRKFNSLEDAEKAIIDVSLGLKNIEHMVVDLSNMKTVLPPNLPVEFCSENKKANNKTPHASI